MQIIYLPESKKDLDYWVKTGNKKILKKIARLTEAILNNPTTGIGKPEALKYNLTGKWSRRITNGHRYVYSIVGTTLYIYSLRGHY